MKYKKGDRVRVVDHKLEKCGSGCCNFTSSMKSYVGKILTISEVGPKYYFSKYGGDWQWSDCMLESANTSKVTKITPYMRKKYMLLKDSFDLKKGAVLEEDGEKYRCITPEKIKYAEYREDYTLFKQIVINNPKWFKEVTLMYVAKEQVKKVEKFLKKLI